MFKTFAFLACMLSMSAKLDWQKNCPTLLEQVNYRSHSDQIILPISTYFSNRACTDSLVVSGLCMIAPLSLGMYLEAILIGGAASAVCSLWSLSAIESEICRLTEKITALSDDGLWQYSVPKEIFGYDYFLPSLEERALANKMFYEAE